MRPVFAGRPAVLFVALLMASTGYAVLTATTETSQLAVVGTIDESAASAAYHILVRPTGSRLPLEESANLLQPGFLQAVENGISLDQWHTVQAVDGVEVAAPVALVGWVVPSVVTTVDLSPYADLDEPVLLRRSTTWSFDNGASTIESTPTLLYVTPDPVTYDFPALDPGRADETAAWLVHRPDGTVLRFEIPIDIAKRVDDPRSAVFVVSTADLAGADRRDTTVDVPMYFPFLIAAVDPESEAELTGLDQAVVSGEYLTAGPLESRMFTLGGDPDPRLVVPALVADAPTARLEADYRVEQLDGPLVDALTAQGSAGADLAALATAPARTLVASGTLTQQDAYQSYLSAMSTPTEQGAYYARSLLRLDRTGPAVLERHGTAVSAQSQGYDTLGWGALGAGADTPDAIVPPGGDDIAFRSMSGHFGLPGPALVKVGVFDPDLVTGTTSTGRVPLGTFAFDAPVGADDASRTALADEPWYPSANIAGYVQPAPLMLTTLDALAAFADPSTWVAPDRSGMDLHGYPPVPADPISAIRVRVAGVTGAGELDRERVRAVAEQIAESTGLDVDITMGSSPGPQQVEVPAGRFGRPALTLTELWVKKGVAAALVSAVDRKSALLSWVVLTACALVVANTVLATVRARRRLIGTVLATGWRRRDVVRHVVSPVLGVAAAAGTASTVLAYALRAALGLDTGPQVAVALPVALAVAGLAATVPAVAASRLSPVEATRAPVSGAGVRLTGRVRSVPALAWRAVLAAPGRSAVAVAGVAVAVAAAGALAAVQAQFRGRAIGTLLGEAVTVQVRAPDLAAVAVTLALAGVGLYHLMGVEIRERAAELATLRAIGWREGTVRRLLLTQAAVLALLGGLVGGGAAWLLLRSAFGPPGPGTALGLALAAAAGLVLAVLVTLGPAARLRRVPTGALLAED